jgi:DNA-directed RNA polymerase specialized sigma24 family protein
MDEILDLARMQLFERGLPSTADQVDPLLFRFAYRRAMDWCRETGGHATLEEGVVVTLRRTRKPPEPPPVSEEARRVLREVTRLAASDPRHAQALEALRQKEAGKSFEIFAAEAGLAPATIRQWIRRFRDLARERLQAPRAKSSVTKSTLADDRVKGTDAARSPRRHSSQRGQRT